MVCSGEKIYCARSPGVGQNKGLRLPTQRCVMTKVYPVVINVFPIYYFIMAKQISNQGFFFVILRIFIFAIEMNRIKHSLSSGVKWFILATLQVKSGSGSCNEI